VDLHGAARDETREAAPRLSALLRSRRDEILSRWRDEVARLPGARGLPGPVLENEVSDLIEELATHLECVDVSAIDESERREREARAAATHGVERMRVGFDIHEVVIEYSVLRALVLDMASSAMELTSSLVGFVNEVMDLAVGTAVRTYARHQALEERRRRSEHIAFVTHHMRTPLATISAVTEMLRSDPHGIDRRLSDMLQQSVARLDNLIRDLIDEARQIRGDLARESRPTRVPLRPLVEAIVADIQAHADNANLALHNEVPEGLEIVADAHLLDITLANLVKNAVDHSGGRRVVIGAREAGGRVSCWVEDDGRGIAPEKLRTIFEPYETRSGGAGVGLGLYIARRFAEALRGEIEASSPSGARFELRFPDRSRG
jgi:two-component system, OmpR family, phosphate regulon sensor histidine kinase PhoR